MRLDGNKSARGLPGRHGLHGGGVPLVFTHPVCQALDEKAWVGTACLRSKLPPRKRRLVPCTRSRSSSAFSPRRCLSSSSLPLGCTPHRRLYRLQVRPGWIHHAGTGDRRNVRQTEAGGVSHQYRVPARLHDRERGNTGAIHVREPNSGG